MVDVRMQDVRKSFDGVDVIKGIDLDIRSGEFMVFVGPSGCGKSTLLRMISGLEEISSGQILIDGSVVNDVDPSARGIAMVFQNYALYPHMSVAENLSCALRFGGTAKDEIARRVKGVSEILGLDALMNRRPRALSGGQRQRVAIGRAIVRDPKVFLFDEPLSNLDAELRVHMRVEIARLHRDLKATMVYVTHDQTEAMTLADRIVVMRAGQVEQVGAPLEVYDNPANLFVAGFIGSPKMNFLQGVIAEVQGNRVVVQLPQFDSSRIGLSLEHPAVKVGEPVTVGIRPEHFGPDGDGVFQVSIDMLEHLGGSTFAYARSAAGASLVLEARGGRGLRQGQPLDARFDTRRTLLFNERGNRLQ
ncbi:sn-glycerol-3-phosphate ABC transporter ATP-binding protein UgpC [Niveibacterium sp. SC-1]|uniref:ABC transporter ATP-binding protein n=1 Tax=Niveibacterium sp. SC-1 TaxID=3135646 RepID=UPI00311D655F